MPPIKDELPNDDDEFLVDADADADADAYKPRPQLPQSNVLMRNLAHLMKQLDDGVIDVDPDYQREVVWTSERMTGLVDSLMENFYIPPIILNDKTPPGAAKKLLVCVDGKQRLSSVLAFVKGIIPCHDHLGQKWWFCDSPSSRRKKVLPAHMQKHFLSKEFVSFEFSDLSPEQEEDLFARVQMGMQLNLAEKMRASTGPWQELAKLFVEDFPDIYGLIRDRGRSKDFQLTLACFSQVLEVMHPTATNGVPTLKTNYAALPKLLKNKEAVDDGLKAHLASVWNTFKDLIATDPSTFTNDTKYLKGVQTFAPIEMVAITVLISMYSETRNNRLLIGDIRALRLALREHFVDLRLNTPVWKFVWQYIDELEAIRGAVEGTAMDRVRSAPLTTGQGPFAGKTTAPSIASTLKATTGKKRGRKSGTSNQPIIAPDAPVTIKQEQAASTLLSSRPPKKQRKTPKATNTPPEPIQQNHTMPLALPSSAINHIPLVDRSAFPELPPFPVHTTSWSPDLFAAESQAAARTLTAPMQTMPTFGSTLARQTGNEGGSGSSSAAPIPSEARRNRIEQLDSYRAPPAPMGRAMPSSSQDAKPVIPSTSSPLSSSQDSRASWMRHQAPPQAPPESQRNNIQTAVTPAKNRAEIGGIIDLTSDDEQERQSLLSSFKMGPGVKSAAKQQYTID